MIFAFQDEYDKLSTTCPPSNYKQENLDNVYRWTFDNIKDERNFISQYHKNPKRFLRSTDLDKCNALGLSMYLSLDGAKAKFSELVNSIGDNIYKTLGTRVAKGTISYNDGVNGPRGPFEHFNHHPYKGYNYSNLFEIIQEEKL